MIERARPLLGTTVRIMVEGAAPARAHAAIEAGFAAIEQVQRLMSFHDPDSDLGRIHRAGPAVPVRVHPWTFEVLGLALELSAASQGSFDISVAPELVRRGRLPRPVGAPEAQAGACWRDIELLEPDVVVLHAPLWIDLGGIAKGYAVDVALGHMAPDPSWQCRINAGGDLRVCGPQPDRVLLRVPGHPGTPLPMVEIADGSLASSSGPLPGADPAAEGSAHIDGRDRRPVDPRSFASVVAHRCAVADALTKVVLAEGAGASGILARYGARAYLHHPDRGWQDVGGST
jgi:thiamine biosynthesis lipoprotein